MVCKIKIGFLASASLYIDSRFHLPLLPNKSTYYLEGLSPTPLKESMLLLTLSGSALLSSVFQIIGYFCSWIVYFLPAFPNFCFCCSCKEVKSTHRDSRFFDRNLPKEGQLKKLLVSLLTGSATSCIIIPWQWVPPNLHDGSWGFQFLSRFPPFQFPQPPSERYSHYHHLHWAGSKASLQLHNPAAFQLVEIRACWQSKFVH